MVILLARLFFSCKKSDTNFYENSDPSFHAYQVAGAPNEIYAYCISHDIYLDSIYVTSPLNIKSRYYYQGEYRAQEQRFLIGNTFVFHTGTWQFTFYGRRAVNKSFFDVFYQREF